MWIVKNNAFVSVVMDWNDSSMVYVRGRRYKDVANFLGNVFLPLSEVTETPLNDYQYRAHISKIVLAEIMVSIPNEIEYTNFKDSIDYDDDPKLLHFAHEVWASGSRNFDERDNSITLK